MTVDDELEKALDGLVTALVHFRMNGSEASTALGGYDSWLKGAVRAIGLVVHAEGIDMLDIAERACDRDEGNWGRRMSIINSAWHCIGNWGA